MYRYPAAKITRPRTKSRRRRMSVGRSYLWARACQVVPQNDGGGALVQRSLLPASPARLAAGGRWPRSVFGRDVLFGFPEAEPTLQHLDQTNPGPLHAG